MTSKLPTCKGCRAGVELPPFTMAFQPIVDVREFRIDAYEALVRGPADEGAGTILSQVNAHNLYAFDQACRVRAIELAARLGMNRQLSINFLPNAVYEPRACIRATLDAAARTGFDPRRLTCEIVETEHIADTPHLLRIIAEYRRQGFQIALDDFATSYSGLIRLADLRPDIVKLDGSYVPGITTTGRERSFIAGMVEIARAVGAAVVAERIETEAEAAALSGLGVTFGQGWLFGRPDELPKLVG